MAKNTNTFEKRRKEMERMRKAQEKRERRFARRSAAAEDTESPGGAPIVQAPDPLDDEPEATPSE